MTKVAITFDLETNCINVAFEQKGQVQWRQIPLASTLLWQKMIDYLDGCNDNTPVDPRTPHQALQNCFEIWKGSYNGPDCTVTNQIVYGTRLHAENTFPYRGAH